MEEEANLNIIIFEKLSLKIQIFYIFFLKKYKHFEE